MVLAADERGKRGNATGLPEPLEERSTLARVIGETGSSRRVRCYWSGCMLQQLGVKERQGLLERIRLGSRDSPFDRSGIEAMGDESRNQEVDCIFQTTSVVARVAKYNTVLGS